MNTIYKSFALVFCLATVQLLVTVSAFAQYQPLVYFSQSTPGPMGSLISDGTFLYGTTYYGGAYDMGSIFRIMPDGTGYERILDFEGPNGKYPAGSLFFDGTFLYGMTSAGGANSVGTIFKLMPDGTGYAKLFDFAGNFLSGGSPWGSLISDGTFLYGMTSAGGASFGGTVFKIMSDGSNFTSVLEFNGTNGAVPYGSLFYDGTFLYGMTYQGGTNNMGTVFKIMPNGTGYLKLLDFNGTNGQLPRGSLISDGVFLYGMTLAGGVDGFGVIFKIKPDGSGYTKLIDFDGANGRYPYGSLFFDGTFLYGMTSQGGGAYPFDRGNIFKILPDGTGYSPLLYFYSSVGTLPFGSLYSDGTSLFGMTSARGAGNLGTIFKILPDGTGNTLLTEISSPIGRRPEGSLISDGTFLYGMTSLGGFSDLGTIFKVKPDGTSYAKLLDFDGSNGSYPYGSLISDGTFLYGMTFQGGTNGIGTVFKILPNGTGYTKLLDFNGTNGRFPTGSLIFDGTFLYGTTLSGGANNTGTIFKIKPDGSGYVKLLDCNGTTGANPGSLVTDGTFLYGMTNQQGSNSLGTIYKIMLDGSGFTKLLDFNGSNGAFPDGSLIFDGTYLYGMAFGGANGGVIFKILPDGSGYFKLKDFTDNSCNRSPSESLVIEGSFLYGMTSEGGSNGAIFKVKLDGTFFTNLYKFNSNESGGPRGSLISDGTFLYGMAFQTDINNVGSGGNVFKFLIPPSGYTPISFNPTSGPIGSSVTINGSNFNLTPSNNIVKFNGVAALVTVSTATSLTTTVPVGATTGTISVTVGCNTVTSVGIFTVTTGPAAPNISNFAPLSGPVGTTVIITGTNFSTTPANNIVYFGATKATVTAATATQLTVTVPVGATYQPITVQVAGLTAYSSKPFVVIFAGGGVITACSFAPKIDFASGVAPLGLTTCDFDGDGKPDVVVTNRSPFTSPSTMLIYRNTSSGPTINSSSLSSPLSLSTLNDPFSATTGDVDGDGKMDIVVANANSSKISLYRNTSTVGNISFDNSVDFPAADPWRSVVIDLDDDGKPEVVASNRLNGAVSVYKNNSTSGAFSAATLASPIYFAIGTEPVNVAVGDINGDAKPDIVSFTFLGNTISVLQNAVTPGVINAASFLPKVDFIGISGPAGLTLADFDGDSKLDILTSATSSGSSISILRNTSGATINSSSFAPKVDFATAPLPYHPAIADLNGDGKLDIAISTSGVQGVSVLMNTSSIGSINSSSFATKIDFSTGQQTGGMNATDIDGDGKPDLLVTNEGGSSISIFQNVVGSILPPAITSFTPSGSIGTSATITGSNFSTPFTNTVKFNGVPATINASTASTLTVTVPVGATNGPIEVTIGCNTVTSASNFTVTVPGTIAISPQPSSAAACDGTSASFTIAASGTTNIAYQWQKFSGTIFTDVINGGGYSGATSAAFSINTTGNFGAGDYRCKVSGDFAPDVFSNTVTLTVNPRPAQPTIPSQPTPACGPSAIIPITAAGGTAGQYRWYTIATGGTAIPSETNATYSPTVTSTPTNFFVAINDGTCESTRTSVTATLVNTPAPTTTGSSACPGSIFTLTASGGTNGQYKWYTVATGGTPIAGFVDGSFTTAALSSTTTFYVTNTASGCESTRTPVTATVITSGCSPVITAQTFNLPIEGKVEADLKKLITTSGILDVNSIKVIQQPASGAFASIFNGVLTIDYKGKPFVGKEIIIIEACTTTGQCSQQTFEIEVAGDIIVFNGVSPNGDGLNEFLKIENIELLPETKTNQVMIYSRWGDEVFKVSDYNNKDRAFKGDTNNGSKLPSGTYFYKIVLPNAGKTMTGFISLKH